MAVRVQPGRKTISGELRRRVEGLEHLPIRPATARQVMSAAPETSLEAGSAAADWSRLRTICDLDPGWVLGEVTARAGLDPIKLVAELPWWPSGNLSGPRRRGLSTSLETLGRGQHCRPLAGPGVR